MVCGGQLQLTPVVLISGTPTLVCRVSPSFSSLLHTGPALGQPCRPVPKELLLKIPCQDALLFRGLRTDLQAAAFLLLETSQIWLINLTDFVQPLNSLHLKAKQICVKPGGCFQGPDLGAAVKVHLQYCLNLCDLNDEFY